MSFSVPQRSLVRALFAVAGLLAVASALAQVTGHALDSSLGGLVRLVDASAEANVPTWYSAILWLACAALAAAIGLNARSSRAPYARHWATLAMISFLAATDEVAQVHELANELDRIVGREGVLYYPWILPGALVALALALAFRGFVRALPGSIRRGLVTAAVVYLIGALALELPENLLASATTNGDATLETALLRTLQDFLEMIGTILLLDTLMSYAARREVELGIAVDGRRSGTPVGS